MLSRYLGFTLALPLVVTAVQPLEAQEYRNEKIDIVGIQIKVSKRLKRLPVKLADWDPNLRARFRPMDSKDYVQIRGRPSLWYTDVLEFKTAKAVITPGGSEKEDGEGDGDGDGDGEGEGDKNMPEEIRKLIAKFRTRQSDQTQTFEQYVKDRIKPIKYLTKGKKFKKKGNRLPYTLWEYLTKGTYTPWYNGAAVYTFPGREVVVLIKMPVQKKDRPSGKWKSFAKTCLRSGRLLKKGSAEASGKSAASRDKFADTPKKKKALKAAKANIKGLKNWDYFTTANYIVIYSWKDTRGSALKMSRRLSGRLEKMRTLYRQYYPPRQDQKNPYSVLRVCATYKQFGRYGDSRRGVVGWFSPSSKELVVFQGGDKMMGKGATDAVTYHEGWHQYCDSYFDGKTIHRWFDEGHGDFFGAHAYRSKKWKFIGSRMRFRHCREMVKKGDYVAFESIVSWPRSKFYSGRPYYYYAQAFSMIDFFRRGHAMGKKFDPSWSNILDTYRRTMLTEGKSNEDATKAAFQQVDWKRMEEAWKDWVNSGHFKSGKTG